MRKLLFTLLALTMFAAVGCTENPSPNTPNGQLHGANNQPPPPDRR